MLYEIYDHGYATIVLREAAVPDLVLERYLESSHVTELDQRYAGLGTWYFGRALAALLYLESRLVSLRLVRCVFSDYEALPNIRPWRRLSPPESLNDIKSVCSVTVGFDGTHEIVAPVPAWVTPAIVSPADVLRLAQVCTAAKRVDDFLDACEETACTGNWQPIILRDSVCDLCN